MYSVYLLLFILAIRTDGSAFDVDCNYICEQKCHEGVNDCNVVAYDSSVINYCTVKDVPTEINFIPVKNERGELTDQLEVTFEAPKRECRYEVALLVEPSITNERECSQYKFQQVKDITTKIHTIERSLCFLTNSSNQLVRYNDNSKESLCKDNILLKFYYIFTGCYALQFNIGRQGYIVRGHKFLNTTYRRVEVTEPEFTCKYDIYPALDERHEVTNFTLDTLISADAGSLIQVRLIPEPNKTVPCAWYGLPMHKWTIDLESDAPGNCSINTEQGNEEHTRTVRCNFQVQTTETTSYCFILYIIDERCYENTIWRPPTMNNKTCTWLKRCTRTFESSRHIESAAKSDKLSYASSYLLFPIVAIVLVVLAIVGALCFIHYLRIRSEEVNLYVNPQQDDFTHPVCLKSTDFDIVETNDSKKAVDRDNFTYDDIVLVYTKGSRSFMAMMKEFREMLGKMCSCTVHDWYDGAEWNDVARVGAVLWFTELLNSGCRVVWIDTPATRSVVISNSRESDTNLNKLSKYYEIGDFRDVAFPVVLELAKRNTKDLMFQYRKHFVVRFEGLESSENLNDPFLDVSPHARYLMPQHFAQLCTDLSTIRPAGYEMKAEEDLLQQRLKFMRMESIM